MGRKRKGKIVGRKIWLLRSGQFPCQSTGSAFFNFTMFIFLIKNKNNKYTISKDTKSKSDSNQRERLLKAKSLMLFCNKNMVLFRWSNHHKK